MAEEMENIERIGNDDFEKLAQFFKMQNDVVLSFNFQCCSFAECYCPEKELQRLVCRALEKNPYSQRLKEALVKQSWDGIVNLCMFNTRLQALI